MFAVAIDGPAGAGKSTVARQAAAKLGFLYVDTGAIYRTVALSVLRSGADPHEEAAVAPLLPDMHVEMRYENGSQRMILNGEDVTDAIRTPEISMGASAVAALPAVRAFLLELQRSLARTHNVLMDGRDVGTVVLPDAQVKIFLTAQAEERARRRFLELQAKGANASYETVLAEVRQRDLQDTTRAVAPLKQAPDARLLDTTHLTQEEAVAAVAAIVEEKLHEKG